MPAPILHPKNLWRDCDEFTRAYIQTALWSSNDNSDDSGGEPLDSNYSWADISKETLAQMIGDCHIFQSENIERINAAIQSDEGVTYGPDFSAYGRAGHDFWLTRNGHGAGFWDGGWPEPFASQLTKSAKSFGTFDLYVGDDGEIYGS